MKKFFLIALSVILISGIGAAVWSFSGYLYSLTDKSEAEIPSEVTLAPDKDFRVGELVTVSAEFTLPRYRKVQKVLLTPGDGTVTAMQGKAKKMRSSWRYTFWKAEGKICPLRPGNSRSGVLALELAPVEGRFG